MKKEIFVGKVGIGGQHPVSIQSMTNTDSDDVVATLKQINELTKSGCQIVRVAVPQKRTIPPFKIVVKKSPIPVIADIHFNADLALWAIDAGAAGIRINPGNIGSKKKIREILKLANQRNIPIRIGVNSGSIEKKFQNTKISKHEIMVNSAMDKIMFFEDNDFFNIKLSLKSSNVCDTVYAYRLIDKKCNYPLHLGITESGTTFSGTIKSAVGMGALLLEGIGNTIRVSLTADPVYEIKVAREILAAAGLRDKLIEIVSCPTCSRTSVDLIAMVNRFEEKIKDFKPVEKMTIAIMGCEVNGPGEAVTADLGLAFSKKTGYIFKKGQMIEKVASQKAIDRLIELLKKN